MNKTKLIEDNMKLVYHIIHRRYPTYRNDEDLIQCGMVGLCKAADTWDGKSSKFSTYAYTCIQNAILYEFRKRSQTIPHKSLDSQIIDDDQNTFHELIGEDVDFSLQPQLESFINTLSPREKDMVELLRFGLTQTETAEQLGMTKQNVNNYVRRMRLKWRNYNENNRTKIPW